MDQWVNGWIDWCCKIILFFLIEKKVTCEYSYSLLREERKTLVVTVPISSPVFYSYMYCFTGLPRLSHTFRRMDHCLTLPVTTS